MENMDILLHIIFPSAFYLAAQDLIAGRISGTNSKPRAVADHLVLDIHENRKPWEEHQPTILRSFKNIKI